MKQKIIRMLAVSMLVFGMVSPVVITGVVYADAKDDICSGIVDASGSGCGSTGSGGKKIDSTIATIINLFSLLVGVAAVLMIIIGGFRYVISQGEGANTAGAKNTILYAVIGLVIVALAQIIVKFVLEETSS